VDAFSIEWTTPREIPGSIENILDDNFLKSPDLHKLRWCIFYDLVLRIQQTPGLKADLSQGMDFDNPDIYNTFVADFAHFAKKYFDQTQYLKIDGRPVFTSGEPGMRPGVLLKPSRRPGRRRRSRGMMSTLWGISSEQINSTRSWRQPTMRTPISCFLHPGSPVTAKDVGEAAVDLDKILTQWEKRIAGLKVAGRDDAVILQPGFAPQFDNRLFIEVNGGGASIYVPALSKDQVKAMAEVVRRHAPPVGSQGWRLVWLNTWNNWAETTTFEPTADEGPAYPAGNYRFDMLEVIREIFGAEIFSE